MIFGSTLGFLFYLKAKEQKGTIKKISLCYNEHKGDGLMEFKDKLRQLRIEKGLSQEAIAKELVISRSTYAKWETGIRFPNSQSLQLIADFYKIDLADLFDDKETTQLAIRNNDKLNDIIIGMISITSIIITCIISLLYFFKLYGTYCIDILGLLEKDSYIYITYSLSQMEGNPYVIISLVFNILFIITAILLYLNRKNKYYRINKIIFIILLVLVIIFSVVAFLSGRFMLAYWLKDYLLVEV